MKRPLILALGAVVATSGLTVNAAESFSPTLGYYTSDIPEGISTMVIGLVKKKDHQGGMDNVGAFSVTAGNTTVEEADRDMTTVPLGNHYMEILDGAWEGLVLDVEAGSATTGSFEVRGDLNTFPGLAPDSAFAIREHATLGDLFPDGGGFVAGNDFLITFDSFGDSEIFAWGGAAWGTVAGLPADDEVIYPGQGILISAAGAREVLVGKNGVSHVKENRTMIPFIAGLNLLAPPNPVVGKNHVLGDLGFPDSIVAANDFVVPFSNDGAFTAIDIFLSDGSQMNTVAGAAGDATPIPVGDAVLLLGSADGYYIAPALDASLLAD